MKRCLLHVGMHKTGTTSVQHNLRRIGNTRDWRYLCVGSKLHMNIPFFAMFATDPFSYIWFSRLGITKDEAAERGRFLREKLADAIREAPEETIIMSAEALTLVDPDGIQRLKDFLAPFFDEIRVIGYVRPPVSFKISIYQELIKQGRKRFDAINIKVSYRQKFEKFDTAFGRENVKLVKFDPAALLNQCIVSDFCEKTGIRLPADEPVERANDGMCREACGILFAYYKHGSGYGTGKRVIVENSWIIKPLQAMRGTKLAIRKSLFRAALDREREDITWMEERLGFSLMEKLEDKEHEISGEQDLLRIERTALLGFADQFESHHGITVPRQMIPAGEIIHPLVVADFVELCKDLARVKSDRESRRRGRKKREAASAEVAHAAPVGLKRKIARAIKSVKNGILDALADARTSIAAALFNRTNAARKEASAPKSTARLVTSEDPAVLEKSVRYNRNDPAGFLKLGVCHLKEGNPSKAREAFASAIFLKPEGNRWFRYYRLAMARSRKQAKPDANANPESRKRN